MSFRLIFAAGLLLSGGAFAADLPSRKSAPPPAPVLSACSDK